MAFGILSLWAIVGLFVFDRVIDQTPGSAVFGLKWALFAFACGPLAWIFGGLIFFMQLCERAEEWWDENDISDFFKNISDKLSK